MKVATSAQGKQRVEGAIGHPIWGWSIALGLGLFVAALSLTSIWMVRLVLAMTIFVAIVPLYLTPSGEKLSKIGRLAVVLVVSLSCIAIERFQTSQLKPSPPARIRKMPQPPLRLMLPAEQPFLRHQPQVLKTQQLQVDYLGRPKGGFASFTMDNDSDDVMLGIDGVHLRNLSKRPMKLKLSLHVVGEGQDFVLTNDGLGRWQRRLNINDFMAREAPDGASKLPWTLSPLEIPAGGQVYGAVGFVAPNADTKLRGLIASDEIDQRYQIDLEVIDEISGNQFALRLPFGLKPVDDPAFKANLEALLKNQDSSGP